MRSQQSPKPLHMEETDVFSFGNSTYDKPFCKVCEGLKSFEGIIDEMKTQAYEPKMKEGLKTKLLSFLKCDTK